MSTAAIKKKLKKAKSLIEAKKFQQAVNLFAEVLKHDPTNPEALHYAGLVAQSNGQLQQAEQYLQASLAQDYTQAKVHYDLGWLYDEMGARGRAIQCFFEAVKHDPENKVYVYFLSQKLTGIAFFAPDHGLLGNITQLMGDATIEANNLFCVWFSLFRFHPLFEAVKALAEDRLSTDVTPQQVMGQPLLVLPLCNAVVQSIELEDALTRIRAKCLLEWKAEEVPLIFLAALAFQGFYNEYVWQVSEAERKAYQKLEAKAENGQLILEELFLLGAYRPLHRLKNIQTNQALLEADRTGFAHDLWQQQVSEPLEEERIKGEITVLTPIEDAVSKNVQAQYEINPYPRWQAIPQIDPVRFSDNFMAKHPYVSKSIIDFIPRKSKTLLAGSGSGKQPLMFAATYKDEDMTAVDLSKTSLAYAIRKSREYQLASTLRFAQADILKLEEAFKPESFDIIYCDGVLHHMDDPMAGWQVLTRLLKPKGLMHIGLYSEIARCKITEMRDYIAKENIPSTDDGIRQLRSLVKEKVKSHSEDQAWNRLSRTIDFYSVSACRDLLFHVQEHQFTMAKLKSSLEELSLQFLGFEPELQTTLSKFHEMFPGVKLPGTFEQWQEFEEANPDIFAAMYQFWVRKP